MSRRSIKSALHNFLGTYTSRYSDFDGHWLFGFLVDEITLTGIDLMGESYESTESVSMARAKRLAVEKFSEQMTKAGIAATEIAKACLDIAKPSNLRRRLVHIHNREGYDLRFVARAVDNHGRVYESERFIFVAPHDPTMEQRSNCDH